MRGLKLVTEYWEGLSLGWKSRVESIGYRVLTFIHSINHSFNHSFSNYQLPKLLEHWRDCCFRLGEKTLEKGGIK